jgi:hypothetical protein
VQGQHRQDKHVALRAPTHAHTRTHTTSNAHTHMGRICTRAWIFPKHIALHAHQLLPAYMGLSQASAASSRSEPKASLATDEYHTVQPQASAASSGSKPRAQPCRTFQSPEKYASTAPQWRDSKQTENQKASATSHGSEPRAPNWRKME